MAEPLTIGKYQIQGLMKRGGMGVLYLGYDPELEREVAIKVIRTDSGLDQLRERFVREAKAVARLRHPNIVTIFEFGSHDGLQFIVMEYIPGQNLAEFIQRETPAPIARRLGLFDGACAGLGFAHRAGIVHRDVKPANLMVDIDGTLKILDFGIARMAGPGLTSTGDVMGTINYMSPEQMMGGRVDHRTDIFALGAVLYELLSGVRAFPGDRFDGVMSKVMRAEPEPLRAVCPGIDGQLESIVCKALARYPDHRYQDLAALRLELASVRERLERSGEVSTVRLAAAPIDASVADAPTTDGFSATTIPLGPRLFAAPIAKSRWVGLTTGALAFATVTSVSWKPLPVHAETPEAIVEVAAPMLPLSARAMPTSVFAATVTERRAWEPLDTTPSAIERSPLRAMPIAVWPQPQTIGAARDLTAAPSMPPPSALIAPAEPSEPLAAKPPALESLSRATRSAPALLRAPMTATLAGPLGDAEAEPAETPKSSTGDDRMAERSVRRSLDDYLSAIASLNPDQVGKVRRLDSLGAETIRRWLSGTRKLDVQFKGEPVIRIRQDSATAECVLHYRIQRNLGSSMNEDVKTKFDLARVGDRWLIDRVDP